MTNNTKQQNLEKILRRLISLLESSEVTSWAHKTPDEIIIDLNDNLLSLQKTGSLSSPSLLDELFAPTCALQDISIDNGWGDEFIKLAGSYDLI